MAFAASCKTTPFSYKLVLSLLLILSSMLIISDCKMNIIDGLRRFDKIFLIKNTKRSVYATICNKSQWERTGGVSSCKIHD